eukprot:scaffold141420_cov18-Tisochrysis_lutea.AAC.1
MASTFLRHLLFYISACYCAVLVLIHHHLHSKPVHVGVQKEPLGSVHDYATRAYSAAQAASSGRVAGDAYEKAAAKAAEEAAAASGARASRHPKDPKYEYERRKHPAEEILDAGSLDVDRAMEGEDE